MMPGLANDMETSSAFAPFAGGGDWSWQGLIAALARRGSAPAVISFHGERSEITSAAQLAAEVDRVASALLARGLAPGEPVALCAPNSLSWIAVGLAVGAAGGVLAGIDDQWTDGEVAAVLADFDGRFVFTSAAHCTALAGLPTARTLTFFLLDDGDGAMSWRNLSGEPDCHWPEIGPDAAALLCYTSGTTGKPKAFSLSHRNLTANVVGIARQHLIAAGDRALLPLPLHHVFPWVIGVLTALSCGVAVILPETTTGPHIAQGLKAGGATLIIGVPRLYDTLIAGVKARLRGRGRIIGGLFLRLWQLCTVVRRRYGWSLGRLLMAPVRGQVAASLRFIVCGGAHLEPATAHELEGLGWDVLSGYGLAETASIFTGNVPTAKRLTSAGRPILADGQIRIAEADAAGIGEIHLKGPNVFHGYRNDPQATSAAFTADGWFRTGDLGFLDADGFLTITGRVKELIVLGGGKKINPEDLEKTYAAHPFIAEIAVLERSGTLVGLLRPDAEALKAAGATRVADAMRVALTEAAQPLPSYQRLAGWAITGAPLPRTRLGKLKRFTLPKLYEQALAGAPSREPAILSDADRAFIERPRVAPVWALLVERYADKPLSLTASPALDLGIDSFEWMELGLELERRFGIVLSEETIAGIETVRDLLATAETAIVTSASDRAASPPGHLAVEAEQWLAPRGPGLRLLGAVLFTFVSVVMRLGFRVRSIGYERVPDSGAVVLAPNHVSDLDPFALTAVLPLSRLHRTFWAADVVRLFASPLTRLLCRAGNVFPVNERMPATTIGLGARVLAAGNTQVWFPESWRSPDGRLQPFLPGIGKLLLDSGAPAVPVFIAGAFEAMPRDRRWPRLVPIRVAFGDPVDATSLAAQGEGATEAERIADGLRQEMAKLAQSIGVDA